MPFCAEGTTKGLRSRGCLENVYTSFMSCVCVCVCVCVSVCVSACFVRTCMLLNQINHVRAIACRYNVCTVCIQYTQNVTSSYNVY